MIVWSMQNRGSGCGLAKFFGYLITLLSILTIACTLYTLFVIGNLPHLYGNMKQT